MFVMKAGKNATDDIVLSLYDGPAAIAQNLLDSVTLTKDAFCTQLSPHCSQFNSATFAFTTPAQLSVGQQYYVTLTSGAPDTQDEAYFIKGDASSFSFLVGSNNPSSADSYTVASVPEPTTLVILGFSLVGLGAVRRANGPAGKRHRSSHYNPETDPTRRNDVPA